MKIIIKGKEITLKRSYRTLMIYERITGETFEPKGVTEVIYYLYSMIVASGLSEVEVPEFNEFMDWLDANPEVLPRFANWLTSMLDADRALMDKEAAEEAEAKETADSPKE